MTGSNILALENSVELFRGTTKILALEVKDAEGEHIDITGSRIVFTVKCRIEDRENVIQKDSDVGATEIEIDKPKEGHALMKLVPSDTVNLELGGYVFDIWIVLASGEQHLIVGPSELTIKAGVTVLT